MIIRNRLACYHEAAKMIETDGVEAYHTVSERFGSDVAGALLVAFIRRNLGSMDTFPAREEITAETDQVLLENRLIA